nr:MAG TPA: hypothetical protein [Caudoviricetes sp.]
MRRTVEKMAYRGIIPYFFLSWSPLAMATRISV